MEYVSASGHPPDERGAVLKISFDDLEVTYPDLDITQMAGDLAKDIKDRIF